MDFSNLLDNSLALVKDIYISFSALFDWFVTPINQHIDWLDTVAENEPWLDALLGLVSAPLLVLDSLSVALGVPNISLALIMLGGGCVVYLVYQFVTWLLNLVS